MVNANTSEKHEENEPLTWMIWKKRRYIVVLLTFFGFFNIYALRVNLSVAIVAMTENRTITHENGTTTYESHFDWNSKTKGLILSSFFYGYISTQILGGYLASKFGGRYVFGIGIFVTAALTLVTPLAAKHSVELLLAIRIIEGIFEGVTFPSVQAIWARWAPPLERSRMSSLAVSGTFLGTICVLSSSGIIGERFGWESIFYTFGTIGCVWFVFWIIIVKDGPENDRFCSDEERNYIQKCLGTKGHQNIKHPIKAILTSTPIYAIFIAQCSETWGFYTLLTQLPTYLKEILHFDLKKTGFVSAIPYLSMAVFLAISGYFADWAQVKGYLTTTQVRKYFTCCGFIGQTGFMILAAHTLDPIVSVAAISLAVGIGSFCYSGMAINPLDIAPQHASIISGIGTTFSTIPGIVSPVLTGYIVQNNTTTEWHTVFYISAGVYLIGCIFYYCWCSGELQEWAKTPEQKQQDLERSQQVQKGHVNEAIEMKE